MSRAYSPESNERVGILVCGANADLNTLVPRVDDRDAAC